MKTIHFICRGNVFRSRLAEAYARSILNAHKYQVQSSGIEANKALNGLVDLEAVKALEKDKLLGYLSPRYHQTTQDSLDTSDYIVFMSKSLHDQANKTYDLKNKEVLIWDIPDVDGVYSNIKAQVNRAVHDNWL